MGGWDWGPPPFSLPLWVALRERSWPLLLTRLGRLWIAWRTVFDVALAVVGILRGLRVVRAGAGDESNEIDGRPEKERCCERPEERIRRWLTYDCTGPSKLKRILTGSGSHGRRVVVQNIALEDCILREYPADCHVWTAMVYEGANGETGHDCDTLETAMN